LKEEEGHLKAELLVCSPSKSKLKKKKNKRTNGLFTRDNIKRFARFTLHTKTTTGIS
jgi:hypothetical protein